MWFKNMMLYRLGDSGGLAADSVESAFAEYRARTVGPQEMSSLGFVPPVGEDDNAPLVQASNDCLLLCAQLSERLLPASVVNEVAREKAAELELERGAPLSRKAMRDLKDEVTLDLMPQAFTRRQKFYAYLDLREGWLVVDVATAKRAEEVIGLMRRALGSLPALPPELQRGVAPVLTEWLSGTAPVAGLAVGDACELQDPAEQGAVVRCRRQDLASEEIAVHLKAGKQVTQLKLDWQERIRFQLNQDFSLRQLQYEDALLEEAAEQGGDDPLARQAADFYLMSEQHRQLLHTLVGAFGGLLAT